MAELGSTGGNLDNILQYLLQRIEKFGIAEGGTGGVARFADLSDVPAATSGKTQYWGWTGSAYAWLNAPEGGGGDVDLSDYYTKTQVNDLLKGYVKTNDLPDMSEYVLLETYNKGIADVKAWATSEADSAAAAAQGNAIANAKAYTDNKAVDTLKAANANATTIVEQALEGYYDKETINSKFDGLDSTYATDADIANIITAIDAVNARFDGYALKAGFNTFTGTNRFDSRIYLSNALLDNVSTPVGAYFVVEGDNNTYIYRHTNYVYGSTYMTLRSDGKVFIDGGINEYIDIFGGTPHLDFHFNNTTDFTSRIIESSSGVLELFSSEYSPGTLKIGNAYITYDSDNNALMVSDGSGGAVNLVAMGDVAAFGGLGSGFDTLTDLTLTNKLKAKYIQATSSLTAVSATIGGVKFYEDDDYCPVIDLSGDGESVGYITGADAFIMGRALVKKLQLYDSVEGNYKDIKYDGDNGYVYITINSVKYKFVMEKV